MTTLLILYVINAILNVFGAKEVGMETDTNWKIIKLFVSGFFCTPFTVLLLLKFLFSTIHSYDFYLNVKDNIELQIRGYIFSGIINLIIAIFYFAL